MKLEDRLHWMKLEDCFWMFPYEENMEILKNMVNSNPRDVKFEDGLVTTYKGTKLDPYERTNAYIKRKDFIPQLLGNVGILPMPAWRLEELETFYSKKSSSWLELKALEVFGERVNIYDNCLEYPD